MNGRFFCVSIPVVLLALALALALAPDTPTTTAQEQEQERYTYTLTESTATYQFWTAPPSERVFKDDTAPTETGSGVKVYAAQNEFEPFQIVVKPASSGNVTVNMGNFGSGITAEIYQVEYVPVTEATDSLGRTGDYPDPLWPLANGATVALTAGENTAFWVSLAVPKTTPAGDYQTSVEIGGVSIPVALHVFDFAIPDELHVKSQMNVSFQRFLNAYSVEGTGDNYWFYVDMMKQFFIDHRLTPKSALWSGGLTSGGGAPYIDYDCATATLSDSDGIWGFEYPANRYLNGDGFNNGTGYPSFMAATFRNNDSSQDQRPDEFCGIQRGEGDWYTAANPATPYNQAWFRYMSAVQSYLTTTGYLDKAYYYMANEPQDQADYDAVAWYSQELKKAAPNFKLMVSEEPRPEIYNHPTHTGAKIDIWLPVLNTYDPEVSHERATTHNEETWIYFLHGTRPPYFNPITLDHPGIESKFTGWFLWVYRVRGIAYYSLNTWNPNPWTTPNPSYTNHNGDLFMLYPPAKDNQPIAYGANGHRLVPSIRFELMRDSLEDYEYLYVLNGSSQPAVGQTNEADTQAQKIISGLTSYTRDSDFLYNLRRFIGMKNGGEIDTIPDIQPPGDHPRTDGPPGNYYINFQDPQGEPTASPLVVDGHEYMKIGWNAYDETPGYGWFGGFDQVMYRYLSEGPNELQRSIIFDDYGRQKVFEFALPNGTYNVTVSVGWQGKTYSHHKITVEGVSFVDDEATTPESPYIVRTHEVVISDKKLTMDMGIFDEYTMLNYMDIEALAPPEPTAPQSASIKVPSACVIGQKCAFTASVEPASATAPLSYTWSPEPAEGQGTSSATYRWKQSGPHDVSVEVSNEGGSASASEQITVGVPALALSDRGGGTAYADSAVAFVATLDPLIIPFDHVAFDFGDGSAPFLATEQTGSSTFEATHTYSTTGQYTARATFVAADYGGEVVSSTTQLEIVPAVSGEVTVTAEMSSSAVLTTGNESDSSNLVSLVISPESVESAQEPLTIRYIRQISPLYDPPPGGTFAGHAFRLVALRGGQEVPDFRFDVPISITLYYDATTFAPEETHLYRYNSSSEQWVLAEGESRISSDALAANDTELIAWTQETGEFGLFAVGEQEKLYLPLVVR